MTSVRYQCLTTTYLTQIVSRCRSSCKCKTICTLSSSWPISTWLVVLCINTHQITPQALSPVQAILQNLSGVDSYSHSPQSVCGAPHQKMCTGYDALPNMLTWQHACAWLLTRYSGHWLHKVECWQMQPHQHYAALMYLEQKDCTLEVQMISTFAPNQISSPCQICCPSRHTYYAMARANGSFL